MNSSFSMLKGDMRYWWSFLLTGVVLCLAGFLILHYPVSSLMAVGFLLGILVFLLGISHIYFVSVNNKTLPGWKWHLFMSAMDIILGSILIFSPGITITLLPFLVGFWFFIRGISLVSYAVTLKHFAVARWGWMLAGGVVSFLFALLIIFNPFLGFFTIIAWMSIACIATGVFNILLAFRLKRIKADGHG